jgi:ACT domain-containing protein
MRAVITVIGTDMVGILAKVSNICYENNINIADVTQSILQELFAMVMLVDLSSSKISCSELSDKMDALSKEMGLSIHVMHENIFNSMHRI